MDHGVGFDLDHLHIGLVHDLRPGLQLGLSVDAELGVERLGLGGGQGGDGDVYKRQVVYELMAAMFDNQAAMAESHSKFEELSLAGAVAGVSIPYHPGAEKYLTEQGATLS